MWKKLAAIAALTFASVPVFLANAEPDDTQPPNNYPSFLQDIHFDGIVIGDREAVQDAHTVCKLMAPPDGGSLWDAAQQVKVKHPNWNTDLALKFADRSVQNFCPNQGSF